MSFDPTGFPSPMHALTNYVRYAEDALKVMQEYRADLEARQGKGYATDKALREIPNYAKASGDVQFSAMLATMYVGIVNARLLEAIYAKLYALEKKTAPQPPS